MADEVLRNVVPFMQPSPARNLGGDCFACSLKAVVDALYPDNPIPFDQVWEAFEVVSHSGKKVLSNTWSSMETACYALREHGYRLAVHRDFVLADIELEHWSYAWGVRINASAWARRVEAWLAAGWLVITEINFAGGGPINSIGGPNDTDHFICIDGQRHFWKESSVVKGASSLEHETHVVCSAKGAYWIDTGDLVWKYGAGAFYTIRKDVTARRSAD